MFEKPEIPKVPPKGPENEPPAERDLEPLEPTERELSPEEQEALAETLRIVREKEENDPDSI